MPEARPIVLHALLVVACGATAPGGPSTAEREVPTGPVPTSMYVPAELSLRIDVAALRASPLAPDLSRAYVQAGLFSAAVSAGGVDPVTVLDAVAVTAREVSFTDHGLYAPRWRVAARHRLGEAAVRAALERAAASIGEPLVWRDSQGVPSARLPLSTSVHAIVLSGPAEVVFGRDDELADVITVVRDHRARRVGDETIEPALLLSEGTVAEGSLATLPPMLGALGLSTLSLRALSTEGGLRIEGLAGTSTGSDPAVVGAQLRAELARVRGNALMTSLGVAGLLDRMVLTDDPAGVRFETSGDWTEMRAVLAILVAAAG